MILLTIQDSLLLVMGAGAGAGALILLGVAYVLITKHSKGLTSNKQSKTSVTERNLDN